VKFDATAGLSLGNYGVDSGGRDELRGRACGCAPARTVIQEACEATRGGMAAVIGRMKHPCAKYAPKAGGCWRI